MTNIQIVDVVFGGDGYNLSPVDNATKVKVVRARARVYCGRGGCPIERHDYHLYSRSEGRLCIRCAITLGALTKVEDR